MDGRYGQRDRVVPSYTMRRVGRRKLCGWRSSTSFHVQSQISEWRTRSGAPYKDPQWTGVFRGKSTPGRHPQDPQTLTGPGRRLFHHCWMQLSWSMIRRRLQFSVHFWANGLNQTTLWRVVSPGYHGKSSGTSLFLSGFAALTFV